jgi:hypothetical protein
MLSLVLWVLGPILECLIVIRAVRGNFLKEYKIFYSYVVWVLLRDLSLFAVYHAWAAGYAHVYWYSQFTSVLVGCGVVWEIYRVALANYPGAARMARSVLLFLFVITMSRILVIAANNPKWMPGQTTLETEREFRIVQSVVLIGLVALLAYYAIPAGRNLKGIMVGYGIFLATSLVQLTLRDFFGDRFQYWWQYIQPSTYIAVLLIWCHMLWTFAPVEESSPDVRIEADYQSLAFETRKQLKAAGSYIVKAIRS